ncbi:MAG: deoxyhypusine synthase, partial [candidate division Zixibacteria bacterium]|nr:deoxyhypusine synthase [candidate division Zixibacteria bacterium]
MANAPISQFIKHHYRHFNAATLLEAAEGWKTLLDQGGKMMVTLAGAMSTAELGISLAEMIRQDKVHAIVCTGANLEEDAYNLVAHDYYVRVPDWRDLRPEDEQALLDRQLNRVTDTCIPEEAAMRRIEGATYREWSAADDKGERYFPHEFLWKTLQHDDLRKQFQIDPADSWVLATMEKQIPIFVPGWEDSTMGNMFAAHCLMGNIKNVGTVRSGVEYMIALANWYTETSANSPIGFFQIGGGIAGDFPICVVPMLRQDVKRKDTPLWAYFCQ